MEIHPKEGPLVWGFWERLIGLSKTAIKKVLGRRHVSLLILETITVEIEATLNDRPLTFVSSELGDPEPLTPAHLLHGRRITCLPYELVEMDEFTDPSYREASQIQKAKVQAAVLRNFRKRWRHEYLTSLREYHKASGNNAQYIRQGDVVIVHDNTPRTTWKMAVVTDLITGKDGLVRSAAIRTANGSTTRPITKLYPLELNQPEQDIGVEKNPTIDLATDTRDDDTDVSTDQQHRPQRASARKAADRMKEWMTSLSAPPEDVMEDEL